MIRRAYSCLFIIFITASIVGCGLSSISPNRQQAMDKTKLLGLDISVLKSGIACKYVGFIGDNGVMDARENGNIKLVMFYYTDGDFFKKCTYVYGQ